MKNLLFAAIFLLLASSFAQSDGIVDNHGCLVRHDSSLPNIYLIFSADSTFEGATFALDEMQKRGVRGNFFLTGNYLERAENSSLIRRIIADGHYLGGHSMRHLLLANWDTKRTVLVSPDSLLSDIQANIAALGSFGIHPDSCLWFLPPFEWISQPQSSLLARSLSLKIINISPGIETYRDYTTPDDPYYLSSDSILRQLFEYERLHNLNGVHLILHLGTDSARTDKLYRHLPLIIDSLTALGYRFTRL